MATDQKARRPAAEPPIDRFRSRPRDVQLTAGGMFVTILGAVLLVGAVVVTIVLSRVSASQIQDRRMLETSGVTVGARVVRLWRDSNDDKTPRVEYAFDVDGRAFDGRSKLPLSWWKSLHTGDALAIRYLPNNPARHFVVHFESPVLPPWLPVFIGLFLAACGLGCVMAVQWQRRLLTDGRIARAVVTKITKHHTSHGGSHRSVAFTFATLSGATVTGKNSNTRKGPEVGESIWFVYDPDNPKRSAVYPFQLVTLPR